MSLAQRYAQGSLAAAGSQEAGEALAAQIEQFVATVASSKPLQVAISHPALKDERASLVQAVAKKLDLGETAQRLLALLVRRNRMGQLTAIARSMAELTDDRAGRLRAKVTSAMPMPQEQLRELQDALAQRLGQPVQAQVRVDPTLIGGMVVEVGHLTFDNSLKNQLSLMADQLGARAH